MIRQSLAVSVSVDDVERIDTNSVHEAVWANNLALSI
jgi:hypothetical protein